MGTKNMKSPIFNVKGQKEKNKVKLARKERRFQKKRAIKYMRQGLTLVDPLRFDIRGNLDFGENVIIDANVIIEGDVVLGDDCYIGSNVVLKNTKIGKGVKVYANCVLMDTEIGDNCNIGPFARTREGTKLGKNVIMGNFGETKNTEIGDNCMLRHVCFLGEVKVEKNVNIGGGTIAACFDGIKQSETFVGENAFIGANSTLVAPLTIEADAFVAAGSTITDTAPSNKLTLGRARQVVVKSWVAPKNKQKE